MTTTINASTGNNLQVTADASGIIKVQSNGVTTNALAWVNFGYVASAITIRSQYNVSSVTRNGVGDYTLNFTNALSDANYACLVTCELAAANNFTTTAPTTTAARIQTFNSTFTNVDRIWIGVGIFGN